MRLTTLCYVEKDGCWLMLHRVKKDEDENAGKWIGIGGHIEENESPKECVRREALEEAGVVLENLRLRGILTFILPAWGNELTFLYTAQTGQADFSDCSEGVLEWIPIADVLDLPLWEGDRLFLPLLQSRDDVFSMKLTYDTNGTLTSYTLEGEAGNE